MQIGSRRTSFVSLLLLLSAGWSSISSANIFTDIPKFNPLGINYDPAPAPEDGPPLSAGALRDPAYLPAEIGGIVGAYVFCVCVVGIALVIINRRSRRAAQYLVKTRDIEMVTPKSPSCRFDDLDPSPLTPANHYTHSRNFSWPSPEKTDRNPYVFPSSSSFYGQKPPSVAESPYVDHRIVEADREMMGRNLEDLYAHVMEQEDAKAAGMNVKELPPPAQLAAVGPVPLVSPQRQGSSSKKLSRSRPSNLTIEEPKSPKSRSSSIISSLMSPGKRKARGMQISSPIPTPLSATFPSNASDEEPLSPRFYAPPPPPPVPKNQQPYGHSRNTSNDPASPTRSIAEQLSADPSNPNQQYYTNNRSITHIQTHRPNQSQTSFRSNSTRGDPISATSATSQTPLYPTKSNSSNQRVGISTSNQQPLKVQTQQPNNASSRTLPFRAFEPALSSPSFSHTTKTTVLERTSPLSPGLNTAGMPRTPWTAGAVPYSPYQPFTPMLPVTPRLVTREERKEAKKKEKRMPVMEMIKGEDELWDSGY